MTEITAYCWRSGLIQFGTEVPDGALPIATGPEKPLRDIVDVLAVHCYDNVNLRVGGIATAQDSDEALDRLLEFQAQVQLELLATSKEVSHG